MLVDGKRVCFNLDTGAKATVVSEEVMKHLGLKYVAENPTKTLCGPDQKPLETLGELYINLLHKETNVSQSVFKIRVLKRNLLGLHAIKALNGTVNWYQSLNIT